MNKWIERAIFINIIFIILYVISDYAMWMGISNDLNMLSITSGTFQDIRVITNYNLFTKQIFVGGAWTYLNSYQNPKGYTSQLANLPLLVFLAMMITNLFLLWKATQKP